MSNNNPRGTSSKLKYWNNEDDKEDNSMGNQTWEYRKDLAKMSGLKVDGCKKKSKKGVFPGFLN